MSSGQEKGSSTFFLKSRQKVKYPGKLYSLSHCPTSGLGGVVADLTWACQKVLQLCSKIQTISYILTVYYECFKGEGQRSWPNQIFLAFFSSLLNVSFSLVSGSQSWATQVSADYSFEEPPPPIVLAGVSGNCSLRTPGSTKVGIHCPIS